MIKLPFQMNIIVLFAMVLLGAIADQNEDPAPRPPGPPNLASLSQKAEKTLPNQGMYLA